ncbi:Alpha crystallin/Hsp20 domain [Trinorchestia longiramus]|nr:Alpha crystallin/Hsp20 domain [Trinorchestia longiramus]
MPLSPRMLPITRRGHFFEDDFFKDFQQDYSSAVRDVLDKCGGRSLLANQFSNYRRARQEDPHTDDSLAASISDTPEAYVIVLDMTDYISGEITVRTKNTNAVVDAKVGNRTPFHRIYPLPRNTNTDAVVVAMSDEGILTINAKKKDQKSKKLETTASVDSTSGDGGSNTTSTLKIDVGIDEDPCVAKAQETQQTATGVSSSETSGRKESISSGGGEYRNLPISRRGQFFKDEFFENVWKDFDTAMEDMVTKQKQRKDQRQEEKKKREEARQEVIQNMLREEEEQRRRYQAERLERQRKASQEMQNQLKLFTSPITDRFASYRTLRNWNTGEDSQASTIVVEGGNYKVALDVRDFADGALDLKCSGDTLTVSGSKAGISFKKEFALPGLGDPEKVTASLSADGVLTITAPKK